MVLRDFLTHGSPPERYELACSPQSCCLTTLPYPTQSLFSYHGTWWIHAADEGTADCEKAHKRLIKAITIQFPTHCVNAVVLKANFHYLTSNGVGSL